MSDDLAIVLDTELGDIVITVHATAAPTAAAYVLGLLDAGVYDGTSFYRTTRLGSDSREPLIQGGPLAPFLTGATTEPPTLAMLEDFEPTTSTGLAHVQGIVSLGRDLPATGHVIPDLFVCLDAYPELDVDGRTEPDTRGFPAFGTVAAGLEVVVAIAERETGGANPYALLEGEILTHPVTINRASRA